MSQFDYIKDIARYGLENDQERLLNVLNELIDYSKKTKKVNFAIQLQSILKEGLRSYKTSSLTKTGSPQHLQQVDDRELSDLILEKLTSDYTLDNIVSNNDIKSELKYFLKEHSNSEILRRFELPVANKVLLHGPSGCGKTLASYVIAGELQKMMIVVNLGAIVSSKLGDTSKNLAKIFRRAAAEDCIVFIDEFDSLGKVRDYDQDHGEMKRVVNTILQLFDYLPQTSIVVAATNQVDMLDEALLRRFDLNLKFELPNIEQIKELIDLTLRKGIFSIDKSNKLEAIYKDCLGLSYYSIQKTLIVAIKRSLFEKSDATIPMAVSINIEIWRKLINNEKRALIK